MSDRTQRRPTPGPWHWHNCGGYWLLVNGTREEPGQYPDGLMVLSDGSAGGEYGPEIDPEGPDGRLVAASWDFLAACTSERLAALDRLLAVAAEYCFDDRVAESIGAAQELLADLRAALARVSGVGEGVTSA